MSMRESGGRGIVVGLFVAGVTVAACKDEAGPSAEDAPEAVAQALCRWYFECGCDEENDRFTSEADCRLEIAGDVQSDIDEGQQQGLTYQPGCVQAVLDFFETVQCASAVDLYLEEDLARASEDLTSCKLFHGDREAGESCTELQDTNSDDCLADLDCENGVCTVPDVRKKAGEACNDMDALCEAGLVCMDINGGTDRKCEDLPEAGEVCKGTGNLCHLDYYCEQSSKTCRSLPGPGKECAASPNVLQQRCNAEGVCNTDTNMCDPVPGGGEDCVLKCADGFVCEGGVCRTEEAVACYASASIGD